MKYSVSVLSALQPETALIFKAFVWKQLPNSQFKPDLYSATSLPLPPLSPFLFSLCQVSSSPFSSPSVCSFVSSTPLVPFIFPLALYLFSFPPLLPFFTSLSLKFSFFDHHLCLLSVCLMSSPSSWSSSPLTLSVYSLPVRPNYLEVSPSLPTADKEAFISVLSAVPYGQLHQKDQV